MLDILNSLEDTNPTAYDKDDGADLGDFTLLDEVEVEAAEEMEALKELQITLLQTAETGDGDGSSGEDQIFLTGTCVVCSVQGVSINCHK